MRQEGGICEDSPARRALSGAPRGSSFLARCGRLAARFTARPGRSLATPEPHGEAIPHSAKPTSSRWLALADQSIVSGANFCVVLLLGRYSPVAELGSYVAGFTILVLILGVQNALVCSPYNVFGARLTGDEQRLLAGSALVHSAFLTGVVCLALAIAAAIAWWQAAGSGFAPLLAALSVACPFALLREFARRFEFARLRMGTALAIDATLAGLQVSALLGLVAAGRLTAVSAHLAFGLASAVVGLVWLCAVRGSFRCKASQVAGDLVSHLRFGRWVLAGALVVIANGYLLHWLLLLRMGKTAAGIMAACLSVAHLANPLVLGISNLIGPQVARAHARNLSRDIRSLVARTAALMGGAVGIFAAALSLGGGYVLAAVFGPEFGGHGATVALLAWAVCAHAVGMPASEALTAVEKPSANLRAGVVGLVGMLLVAWWLLPYGPAGAAAAMLAGSLATTCHRTAAIWRATSPEAAA